VGTKVNVNKNKIDERVKRGYGWWKDYVREIIQP
jgi:hypothetical protein